MLNGQNSKLRNSGQCPVMFVAFYCLPALDVAVPVVAVLPVRLPQRGDGAAHRRGDGGHAGQRAAPDQRGDAVSHQIQRLATAFILLMYIVNLEIK